MTMPRTSQKTDEERKQASRLSSKRNYQKNREKLLAYAAEYRRQHGVNVGGKRGRPKLPEEEARIRTANYKKEYYLRNRDAILAKDAERRRAKGFGTVRGRPKKTE